MHVRAAARRVAALRAAARVLLDALRAAIGVLLGALGAQQSHRSVLGGQDWVRAV